MSPAWPFFREELTRGQSGVVAKVFDVTRLPALDSNGHGKTSAVVAEVLGVSDATGTA